MRGMLWACTLVATVTLPLGGFSLGLHVPLILALAGWTLAAHGLPRIANAVALMLFAIAIGLHFVGANLASPCQDAWSKSVLSFGLFVPLVLALAVLAARSDDAPLEADLRLAVLVVVGSLALHSAYLFAIGAPPQIRASGIFLEPSHLALTVTPLLVALVFATGLRDKLWGWGGAALVFALGGSATFFVVFVLGLLLAFLEQFRGRWTRGLVMRAAAGVAVLVALVTVSPFRDDFTARALSIGEIDPGGNPSSLVYIDGWLMALDNLATSHGLGLGFNRMGCEPRPITETGHILELIEAGDSNYNDGSFTFAKVLSEFGWFGVALWALAIVLLVRMVFSSQLGALAGPATRALAVAAATVMVLGGFIRGTNYFSGPFLYGFYFLLMSVAHTSKSPPRIRLHE